MRSLNYSFDIREPEDKTGYDMSHEYPVVGYEYVLQQMLNDYGESSDDEDKVNDSDSDGIFEYGYIGDKEISHYHEDDHTQDDDEYGEDLIDIDDIDDDIPMIYFDTCV